MRLSRLSPAPLPWRRGAGDPCAHWFGSALLGFAGLLAAATAAVERRVRGEPGAWWLVTLILGYLSVDEVAQLHEKSNRLLVRAADAPAGIDVIGLVFVALVCVLLLRFVLRLDAPTRWGLLLGGAVFVTGAAGIELATQRWLLLTHDAAPVALVVTPLEKLLEMLGAYLVIRTLLRRLANASGRLELRFRG